MRPVLPFATPWVIEDGFLLLDDDSGLDVCDQPCVRGTGFGAGRCEGNHGFAGPFSRWGKQCQRNLRLPLGLKENLTSLLLVTHK